MSHAQTPPAFTHPGTSAHPHVILENAQLKALVFLPDADKGYYRGPRFDWSGQVALVQAQGHTFFGPTKAKRSGLGHDDIDGPVEEFGMDDTPGWQDAKPGETFVKIGVGELVKPEPPEAKDPTKPAPHLYQFYGDYKLAAPGQWKITQDKTWIQFEQDLKGPRGIAYRYVKRVELAADKPSFTIKRELTNTGTRKINVDHYNHNFTIIDHQPTVGPQYVIEFPFDLKPAALPNPKKNPPINDSSGIVKLDGKRFTLTGELGNGKSFHCTLAGYSTAADNQFRVLDVKSGAAMKVVGDQPMIKLCVWSMNPMLCPEPFVAVKVEAGQTMKWDTVYVFEAAAPR